MSFRAFLKETEFIVLDGAMGTELIQRGCRFTSLLWSAEAVSKCPELIKAIHTDYIEAGADIITANTFRTDPWTFSKAGLSWETAKEYLKKAVQLSKEAIAECHPERDVFIAGSISPLEDCYKPELSPDYDTAYKYHRTTALWLKGAGVDLILIETMNSLSEATAATLAAMETELPIVTSFVLRDDGKIFNGDNIEEAYKKMLELGIDVFSINCTHHTIIESTLDIILPQTEIPICAYVNKGRYIQGKWEDDPEFSPEQFSLIAKNWYERGVKIIGGCCFTNPEYIHAVSCVKATLLHEKNLLSDN